MTAKTWLIIAGVLVVAGFLFGGVLFGLFGASATAAAVQVARRRQKKQLQQEQQIEDDKKKRIEQIDRDIKHEARIMHNKTNAELKQDILKDLDDLDPRR